MICWKWNNGTNNIKSPIKKPNTQITNDQSPENEIIIDFNKREQISENLNIRQPVAQMNTNPYLSDQNYITHVENRDNFLKPINTSRIKN